MKVKLQNFSKSNQLLMLDVLDYLVDKGNMNIWSSISSKKFFQSLLDLLRTRDIPEVQMKLLGLIQKWGLNFEDKRSDLPNFFSVYNKLRNSNIQFPNNFESNYQKFISNSSSNNHYRNNDYENRNDDYEDENSDKDDVETFYYMDSLKNKLKVPNFEHKYRRLVNFLVKMHENIQMANLLMDSRERSGLKDIINTLREGNNTLIDTISGGRLKDEKLMEITLGTTEDINQTLDRNEDIKSGCKPKKFTSYFVLNNVIPIKGSSNYRSRAKSTKPKKSSQRRDEKYKNYDMDLNGYNQNKYKEKLGGPKNVDDIFDLFSASNPSNEPGYNQSQNNQPINSFFSPRTQIRGNSNNNQYPQLRNNPMNNLFNSSNNNRNTMIGNNNNNNNNNNNMNFNNNFLGNNQNNNNNFGRQFNQNNNQQRPVMTNFDILEQKLNNLNFEQNNNNNFNFNSKSTQINLGFNNNNNNNINNNNNCNLMNMLDQLGPVSQGDTNQLVPYIGNFNQNNNNNNMNNNNNNMNNNNFMNNNNNNNSQFNNFNNNNPQLNNFNNNNNNNRYSNNQFNNNNNFNNSNSINFSNNFNNNNSNQFNNNQNNFRGNNNDRNMFNMQNNNNNNQMNFDTNLGRSQNMNNNNFGMGQNDNQQMNLEELEKQQKLKELDDLF